MIITVFSFFMAFLISSVFILVVHFLRNNRAFLKGFGVPAILLLYGICIGRLALPLEFPFTIPVRVESEYGGVLHQVTTEKLVIAKVEIDLFDIIGWVWAVGAIVMVALFLSNYIRSLLQLQKFENNRCPEAEEILRQLQEATDRNFRICVFLYPKTAIPMGVGVFRKKILLPQKAYEEKELYYILSHEYAHFFNHDQIVKLFIYLFQCVFWWNPLVYLLWHDVEQMLEIKCDLTVCSSFSDSQRAEYMQTLIRVIQAAKRQKQFGFRLPAATLLLKREKPSAAKERFRMLADPPQKQVVKTIQTAFFSLFVILMLLSYIFVFQPFYEPPEEDVYTDTSVQEASLEDCYISKHKNGSYHLVMEGSQVISIDQQFAESLAENGYSILEE